MNARLNLWCFLGFAAGLMTPQAFKPWIFLWVAICLCWWSFVLLRRVAAAYMLIPALALCLVAGCAATDKASIYTEEGLRGAEEGWGAHFNVEANRCEALHEPQTPAMEACFGATYDADAAVAVVVTTAVGLLRAYWIARAAGENPDFAKVLRQVGELVDNLPPEAKRYFDRVKGIP